MKQQKHIGVMGAGAWGTALAQAFARAGNKVTLWGQDPATVDTINKAHYHPKQCPEIKLEKIIQATLTLKDLSVCDAIALAVPAQNIREVVTKAAPYFSPKMPLIIGAKGIEQSSLKLLSQVLKETCPENTAMVLSGPGFAKEVMMKQPTAVTLACEKETTGKEIAETLSSEYFRVYYASDIIGAQVGGAVKNVLAIACGIAKAEGFGENTRAALITRGLAEMRRLCVALGGNPETLLGLSGVGDLLLTCTSETSRNMALGMAISQSGSLEKALAQKPTLLAEGVASAKAVAMLADVHHIEMPIAKAVNAILHQDAKINHVIHELLARRVREE